MASPPNVSTFVLCDAAIRDPATGRITLVGVFDHMLASQHPAAHGPFAIYFKMTGLHGPYDLRVEIVAPDLETVVAAVAFPDRIASDDPLGPIDAAVNLPGLELPGPGRYAVRLIYNGLSAEELSLVVQDPT